MSNVPHLPVLRLGRSYESLDKLEIKDHRTGEETSQTQKVLDGDIDAFIRTQLLAKRLRPEG